MSEKRAETVFSHIVSKFGLVADRPQSVGLGPDRPLVATAARVAKPRDRRVLVVNLGVPTSCEVSGGQRVKQPVPDPDDTIRLLPGNAPPRLPPRNITALAAAAGMAGLMIAAIAAAVFWSRPAPAPVSSPAQPLPAAALDAPLAAPLAALQDTAAVPEVVIETASIDQIRSHQATDVSVFRLAETPRVVVLDFASLARQGRTLDRIAALIEKADLPKDRILTPDELERAVKAFGDTAGGFYYGHDYSAASLRRFFSVADRDGVALTPDEASLRALLQQLGWLDPDVVAGLVSAPAAGADERVTVAARDAILSHELSHGAYFSEPDYAAYVHEFFRTALTAFEQTAFRAFLDRQGYDAADPELVENETQAYLVFTPNPLFFKPSDVRMTPERRTELRLAFERGMPDGWPKTMLAEIR